MVFRTCQLHWNPANEPTAHSGGDKRLLLIPQELMLLVIVQLLLALLYSRDGMIPYHPIREGRVHRVRVSSKEACRCHPYHLLEEGPLEKVSYIHVWLQTTSKMGRDSIFLTSHVW